MGVVSKTVIGGVLAGVLPPGLALSELMGGGTGEPQRAASAQSNAAQAQVAAPDPAAARQLGRLDAAIAASTPASPAHLRLLEERARVARAGVIREALRPAELCRIRPALAMGTPGSPGYLRLWEQAETLVVQGGEAGC